MQTRGSGTSALGSGTSEAAELRALYALTDRLYRAGSLEDVYDAALDAIVDTLGCGRASILLFDAQGVMQFVAWRGLSDTYRRTLAGHSPWKPGDRDPEPILVADILESGEPGWVTATIAGEGIRGLGFVPIVAHGVVIGKFMTYFPAPHAFSPREVEVATTIARQVGFSLERARAEQEREAAAAQRELLLAELGHRVKNTLAVVQAIARQTFKQAGATEAGRAFEGRLSALAAAHDLLTRESWDSAPLTRLAADALRANDARGARVALSGPEVLLPPKQAVAVTLALHELFTNALKYGALSNDSGQVSLAWQRTGEEGLSLAWTEAGGPPVTPPERRGFGSVLIERALAHDCDATVRLDYLPAGVSCRIEMSVPPAGR